jgi:hypothetical protein
LDASVATRGRTVAIESSPARSGSDRAEGVVEFLRVIELF